MSKMGGLGDHEVGGGVIIKHNKLSEYIQHRLLVFNMFLI